MAEPWEQYASAAPEPEQGPWDTFKAPAQTAFDQRFTGEEAPPPAFMDRIARGNALTRILSKAAEGAKEGYGESTPTGLSDETLEKFQEWGIFHDPARGGGTAVQYGNEAAILPIAKAFDTVLRAANAGIHSAGEIIGQISDELGASQGASNRAKNEVINFGNWAMIEGGMGRFSRAKPADGGAVDQAIGTLPRDADFANAAHSLIEKVGPAAIKTRDGSIFTGSHHGEAYEKAVAAGHDLSNARDVQLDGFVTSTGRYVDRTEAARIASQNDQIISAEELKAQLGESGAALFEKRRANAAAGEGGLSAQHLRIEQNLRVLWQERGIHPAEAVHDAERDAFLAHDLSSAAAEPSTLPPADVPFSVQPAPPSGRLAAAVQATADKLLDIGADIQMKVAPMATGTTESMAAAKDFANVMRRNRWEWSRVDDDIGKRFTPEQRTRMWNAADEESVLRQEGKTNENMGLATLTPEERAAVDDLQTRAQNAWLRAHDAGLVEGEGLPAYTPRMVINTANAVAEDRVLPLNSIGNNLKTTSGNLKQRKYATAEETEAAAKAKYGEQAELARDIRTLPLATAKLEDAIAGRSLINNIRDVGKSTGEEAVAEGAIPAGSEHKWFTLDHPAFRTWKPKFEEKGGKVEAVKDAEGNPIFEQVPIYVRDDFEGPLRAVLNTKSGPLYTAAMELKGKTMSLVMYSPAIHNMVEFGRAFPAMPTRIFKAYFDGNRAKNDLTIMREAIDNGLVPIGKRFFKQDIDAVMEAPDLTPGRSWTSKILAAVPGLFDEAAGTAVKRAVDKAGDFWHNTLLWDRIADLQMGIYTNMRGDLLRKGVDPQTSSRIAAHLANRYAGALPQEAMSAAARKTANMFLFSRSFTMGNLGVMKDMLTGMPKDVLAQIERDMGQINPEAAGYAKSLARRKAIATITLDIGLMYVGNSVLQSAFNVMLGDQTLDQEMHGYVKRLREVMNDATAHPLSMLQPFDIAEKLSATSENEPGRKERVKIGYQKDGTAIYARNPVGKIGEEFTGYLASPLDMLRRKQGTIARPMLQVLSNDKGFGRKVYDPNADTPVKYAANIWAIVEHFAKAQAPEGQINAFADLVKGDGDPKTNLLQTVGPFAGVTFSKGAPGGPAVGELYKAREVHDYQVNLALPDIRKQIQRGDVAGAQQAMTSLGIPGGLQRFYIRTSQNPATRLSPRAIKDFYQYATPEQRARMERARSAPNAMTGPDF